MADPRALDAAAPPRPGVTRYLVHPAAEGERLDRVLAAVSGLSRRQGRSLLLEGSVWLNGRAVRVQSKTVRAGDVLDVLPTGGGLAPPAPLPPEVSILYEDGWVVAADKPAGVHAQPPREHRELELSLVERVTLQLAAREGHRCDVILFHRLDRITSGVMVFARQHEATAGLARAWASGEAAKRYLAVVRGDPGSRPRTCTGPIGPDPAMPGRFHVTRDGKPARTEIRPVAAGTGVSLVEVRPFTGRTHQVRVHLAHEGFPVAGDALYGDPGGAPRPFLHAWRLALPHPGTGAPLALEAPVPRDMSAFLASRGIDAAAIAALC